MVALFINNTNVVREKLYDFQCENCGKIFSIQGKWINLKSIYNKKRENQGKKKKEIGKYCSNKCSSEQQKKIIEVSCTQCNTQVIKRPSQMVSKKGNSFCSQSCAAKYNNAHKNKGSRRSKLEIWLEDKLKITYNNLEIIFNGKNVINSELDIYIPSLNLAVELNGIFHYEPIYGIEKLASIKNNDERKFQACLEKNIELIIIDNSSMKIFKEHKAFVYFNIIKLIIDNKLSAA